MFAVRNIQCWDQQLQGELWILPRFGGIFTPGASKGLGGFSIRCNSVPLHWHRVCVCLCTVTASTVQWLPEQLQCDACSDITPRQGQVGHNNIVVMSQPCKCFIVSPGLISLVYRRIRVDVQHWWGPGKYFLWLPEGRIFGKINSLRFFSVLFVFCGLLFGWLVWFIWGLWCLGSFVCW